MMKRSWTRMGSALFGIVMSVVLVFGFGSPASANSLYYKVGTHVTKAHVFDGVNVGNMQCFAPSGYGATMCIRYDRRTIYVRSDKKDGYFKLGQISSAGRTYLCQNNHKRSKGQGTWVACHWNWPKRGCYVPRTGHGQADWYRLSFSGGIKCY
jgi:hypothetical protein